LLKKYGFTRHPTKGVWGSGSTRLEHLGFVVDTEAETFCVPERMVFRVMEKARALLKLAARNWRLGERKVVESFV
jgi:hypothetical protein